MIRRGLFLILAFLLCAGAAKPDGGAVVFTATANSLIFTVFVNPSPVHAGQADLSVLLQRETDRSPVLNARVSARLTRQGSEPVELPLTHTAATDKLLYAASVDLPEPGAYRLDVQTHQAQVSGTLVVLPQEAPLLAYWPYFVVVPFVIGLFFLNRYLKQQRQRTARVL